MFEEDYESVSRAIIVLPSLNVPLPNHSAMGYILHWIRYTAIGQGCL